MPGWIRLIVALACAVIASCGAKLPREVSVHQPVASGVDAALREIVLTNLADGSPVSLGAYMESQNLQWLVLTFGSKGCGICMEKARYFESNLVSDYNILGDAAKNQIQLIGVTTDPASDRPSLLALAQEITHLKWSDPGHDVMMRYFQPEGMRFSVPLTVMLSRQGVLWKITSKEQATPAEIIQKIAATIGSNSRPDLPPETEQPPVVFKQPLLAREVPERFMGASVTSCSSSGVVAIGERLPPATNGLRGVLLHRGACAGNTVCENSTAELNAWVSDCQSRGDKSCAWIDIADAPTACSGAGGFSGGAEFYEIFADHFTWSYAPIEESNGGSRLPDIKGPLVLIVDESGKLVFSHQGGLNGELTARMNADRLTERAIGPDFKIASDLRPDGSGAGAKPAGFSDLRKVAKYTMVMFWNTWCSSCTDEILEWHEDQESAFHQCKKHPGICQVVALETKRSESGLDPEAYLSGLIQGNDDFDGWLSLGWSMPLAVDGIPAGDGAAPKGWSQGWLPARFGTSEPMTVLYDREGKVVGKWRSLPGEHGPRETIKEIIKMEVGS
jgi:hypothetical protein